MSKLLRVFRALYLSLEVKKVAPDHPTEEASVEIALAFQAACPNLLHTYKPGVQG